MSLSALSDELSQVRTKKREFLVEIDRIVPWGEWISLFLADRPCLTARFIFALRANSGALLAVYGLVALRFFFYGIARCCLNV